MIETISHNIYRMVRNFTFLVALQFNLEIIAVPIYYVVGLFQWGWYAPSLLQYKLMLEEPGLFITRYAMLALLILFFWEIFTTFWSVSKFVFRKGAAFLV